MNAIVFDTARRYALGIDQRVVPASAWIPLTRAQELVDQANAAVAATESELRMGRAAAHTQGLAEGRAEALEKFAGGIRALDDARTTLGAQMRGELVELAIAIVERIAPAIGADKLIPVLAGEAVRQLSLEPNLVVRVHPDVAAATRQRLADEGIGLNGVPSLEIVATPEYSEFDCVIETDGGVVRAGLGEQLARVQTILAIAREQSQPAPPRADNSESVNDDAG